MDSETRERNPRDELAEINARLAELSGVIYGGNLELRAVQPGLLRHLDKNARYFSKSAYDQLVANLRTDGVLASVPLCHELPDGTLEILSGNHRVKAACDAGLAWVVVLVLRGEMGLGRKRAIQISHNALVGQDDRQILAEIWREMETLADKAYSGLDSDVIAELERMDFSGLSAEQLRTQQMVLWFLPEEAEAFEQVVQEADLVASADAVYVAPRARYEKLLAAVIATKKALNIRNTGVAMMVLIDRLVSEAEAVVAEKAMDTQGGTGGE